MNRETRKALLLDVVSKLCMPLGVLFLVVHQPLLAVLAFVASIALAGMVGTARKNAWVDEAVEAKAEWDRRHPEQDSPEER